MVIAILGLIYLIPWGKPDLEIWHEWVPPGELREEDFGHELTLEELFRPGSESV